MITNLDLSANNPNNPNQTAGLTFLGQFVDHDITFDASSRLGTPTGRRTRATFAARPSTSTRCTATVRSPITSLYDPADGIKFRLECGGLFEDLPRTTTMEAIVADPRNDENLIISGLQCAFLLFHNNAVDAVRANGGDPADAFAEARRLTTWHYQWIVVHELLPHFVGGKIADEVLFGDAPSRGSTAPAGEAFMPVEFQTGTYRIGPQHDPPVVPGEPRRRRRRPVLRLRVRHRPGWQHRSRRLARRVSGAAPVRRLADVLRFR